MGQEDNYMFPVDDPQEEAEEPEIGLEALNLYRPPFKYHCTYIFDADQNMLMNVDAKPKSELLLRGWGRIQYEENAEKLHDEVGEHIAKALTAYWTKQSSGEELGAKVDPTSDACRKCPWKDPAITLAGASWRLRQWYQCCSDEEEGQVEHLRDLAKWACDKIRDLQALDKKA